MHDYLAHLYNTNRTPSNLELAQIKLILQPDDSELSRLQDELEEALQSIENLRKEIGAIKKRIRPLKALSSLIRRLPHEIMGLIFLFTRVDSHSSAFQVCDSPLLLLRICRPWRDIALNTPELWASFSLTIPHHLSARGHDTTSPGFIHKITSFREEVERWFVRSGNSHLRISIRQGRQASATEDAFFTFVIRKCLEHSQRLKVFEIDVNADVWKSFAPSIDPTAFPNLDSLGILDGTYSSADEIFLSNNFFQVKTLKKLNFFGKCARTLTELRPICATLMSLSLGASRNDDPFAFNGPQESIAFTVLNALPILNSSPLLKSLSLRFTSSAVVEVYSSEDFKPIALDNLEALNLKGPCSDVELFLQLVGTPRIRELTYIPLAPLPAGHPHIGTTTSLPATCLINYLERHGNQLETITIDYFDMTNAGFIACLKNIPAVKHLTLGRKPAALFDSRLVHSNLRFDDSHLSLLTPNPDCLCPKVETFTCNFNCRVKEETIVKFVKAKTDLANIGAGVSRIREVVFASLQLDFPLTQWLLETSVELRDADVRLDLWKPHYYYPAMGPTGYFDDIDTDD